MKHQEYMKLALEEANKAYELNEIPVGALIVINNEIISRAYNQKDKSGIVTRHAEIIAIEDANKIISDWRLNDAVLYVTLKPCPMCASAIQQSRIKTVVYGADSNDKQNNEIVNKIFNDSRNHKVDAIDGILQTECSRLIDDFFEKTRSS